MNDDAIAPDLKNKIIAVLARLREAGIEMSAVITRDGTMLAADTPPGEENKIFAPMYAAMLGAAEEATSELRLGIPRRVVMEVGEKKLIATGAGPKALVVALVSPGVKFNSATAEVDRMAAEVKAIMAK